MNKLIFVLTMATFLVACSKKYEEKTGTFSGYEVKFDGSYDLADTFDFGLVYTQYTLIYIKKDKAYKITSATGNLPAITFDREEFEDDTFSSSSFLTALTNVSVEKNSDSLHVSFEKTDLDEYHIVAFDGKLN